MSVKRTRISLYFCVYECYLHISLYFYVYEFYLHISLYFYAFDYSLHISLYGERERERERERDMEEANETERERETKGKPWDKERAKIWTLNFILNPAFQIKTAFILLPFDYSKYFPSWLVTMFLLVSNLWRRV